LGLTLQSVPVRSATELADAFTAIISARAEALLVDTSGLAFVHRRAIAEFAAKHRLPAIYAFRQFPEDGGLMTYGVDLRDLYRRAAGYVDKIFKGAKPGDLPVEQPTKFDLVINLKTAKALGLTHTRNGIGRNGRG
jgi:putative ABC transport system substrate-binding protein